MKAQNGTLNEIDLDRIARLIDLRFELKARVEIAKMIDEKISFLPTKDEFYQKMDEVLSEVKGMREEFAAHKGSHERIDEDTATLKQQVKHLYDTLEIETPVNPAF